MTGSALKGGDGVDGLGPALIDNHSSRIDNVGKCRLRLSLP